MSTGNWSTVIVFTTLFLLVKQSGPPSSGDRSSPTLYDWRVVRVFPHDSTAFTQGLIFHDGYLYESTGRKGQSTLRKVRLETGEVIQKRQIGDEYFAEGLAKWGDQLVQLTLSSGKGFVYDLQTFEVKRTFQIEGDGWGLTNDNDQLIMSDGTSALRFLNPETFREVRRVTVTDNGEPVPKLNELERIGDRIFANVMGRDEIVIIDPRSGAVTGRIDLQKLVFQLKLKSSVNILNGIAYDSNNDRIYITGKNWPVLYELEIKPRESM